MRVNLALSNIRNSLSRTVVSLAGIGIAITLIFVQLGFRGAVENTALMIYEKMDFDLIVRSRDYLHFIDSGRITRDQVDICASVEGVKSVSPFHVTLANWRNPINHSLRGMVVMGISPGTTVFLESATNAAILDLSGPTQILVDSESNPEFGPVNGEKFSEADIGSETELAGRPVRIAGLYEMGAGLTANGSGIMTADGYSRLVPWNPDARPAMALIKKSDGRRIGEIARQLRELLSTEKGQPVAEILTRTEVMNFELNRWIGETPIGFVFTLGVGTAFIVGAAIFYMVLSTDVANRLGEYATLRAMGYSSMYLASVVLRQAFWLSLLAFVPSVLVSVLLYEVTGSLANIPISMNFGRLVFVFLLTQLMCAMSGALALRKLWGAEPASLF